MYQNSEAWFIAVMGSSVTMDDDSNERSIRARQTVRIVVWVVIAAAVFLLAVSNTQDVTVDWLFGNVATSLWVVIVASAGVGAVLGYLARWRRH